jgi:hypothetical protein
MLIAQMIGKRKANAGKCHLGRPVSGCVFIAGIALLILSAVAPAYSQIFVSDFYSPGTIDEYSPTGSAVSSPLVRNLSSPWGIAISGNDLFVANNGNGTIGEYTTSGATVNASLISGLTGAVGLTISGNDLYVSRSGSGVVGEYTLGGVAVNPSFLTGLNSPFGLAAFGNDLFVTSFHGGTVGEYDSTTGGTISSSLISGLQSPSAIASDGSYLFVSNNGNGTIGKYTMSGASVAPNFVGGFGDLEGLAVSGGSLYALDASTDKLNVYNAATGALLNTITLTGLHSPVAMAIENISAVPEPGTWAAGGLAAAVLALQIVQAARFSRRSKARNG